MGDVISVAGAFPGELVAVVGEADVRRRLNRAVGQALVDPEFASWLLAVPDAALGRPGCSPRQQLALRYVRASSLPDFARQVEQIFWPSRSTPPVELEQMPRAVAR